MPAMFLSAQIPSVLLCNKYTSVDPKQLRVPHDWTSQFQHRTSPLRLYGEEGYCSQLHKAPWSQHSTDARWSNACALYPGRVLPVFGTEHVENGRCHDMTMRNLQNCEVKMRISCGSLSIPQVIIQSNAPEELHQCVKDTRTGTLEHVACKRIDRHRNNFKLKWKAEGHALNAKHITPPMQSSG